MVFFIIKQYAAHCLGAEQIHRTHTHQVLVQGLYRKGIHYGLRQKHMCALFGHPEIIVYGEEATESRAKGVKSEFSQRKQTKTYGY